MWWPFSHRETPRAVLEARILALQDQLRATTEQLVYWRTRAERLTDAALAKRGEIHEPVFVDRKPANPDAELTRIFGGLAVQTIESKPSHQTHPGQDAGRRATS